MAFWFGRKSAPERQMFVPTWLDGEGEGAGFARGYEAQLDEVYRRIPVGLRAVRLVAGLVGSLPLFADQGDAKAVELVRTGGLLERAAANLLLHGMVTQRGPPDHRFAIMPGGRRCAAGHTTRDPRHRGLLPRRDRGVWILDRPRRSARRLYGGGMALC